MPEDFSPFCNCILQLLTCHFRPTANKINML
jgi:hypothetical protein